MKLIHCSRTNKNNEKYQKKKNILSEIAFSSYISIIERGAIITNLLENPGKKTIKRSMEIPPHHRDLWPF